MPSPSNVTNIRADMRMQALLKKQEGEHQHMLTCHGKEMQALRDQLSISRDRFDSLFEHVEGEVKDLALYVNQQILFLSEKVCAQEIALAEQKKTVASLHEQLNAFHEAYASKNAMEIMKDNIGEKINASTERHINSFQTLERDLKALLKTLDSDLIKLLSEQENKIALLSEKGESNFTVSKIDREGVLKEVRIYKHDMFVIEKKIENIYTLIDRINKQREETVCRKQE